MVARILGVDRDDGQVRQVLAFAERQGRYAMRLVDRFLAELVTQPVLVDRDEREAARRERIAEHGIDPSAESRRTPGHLTQDEVAGLGVLQVADVQLAPLSLVDGRQPETLALLLHHSERQLRGTRELLHRVRDESLSFLLGSAEYPVADAERGSPPALDHPQPRRRSLGVPLLRHGPDI